MHVFTGRDDARTSRHSGGTGKFRGDRGDLHGLPVLTWRDNIQVCVLDYCLLLKIKWGITFFQYKVLIKSLWCINMCLCIAWIHHKPLFLVWCLSTVATSTDCLNTTVTRSLMRWPSFSLAIKFPPISQIYPLKCSPREYAKHGIAQTCLHMSRFSGLLFISTSTMGKYSGTTYRE